jgi:hypothetical protein
MNSKTFTQVWTIVHLFAVYVGVNAILVLRNSPILLPLIVGAREGAHRGEASMALFWLVLSECGLALSAALASIYIFTHGANKPRVERAPVMFSLELIDGTKMAWAYQVFWLILAMGLSMVGVAMSDHKVLTAEVYECDSSAQSATLNMRSNVAGVSTTAAPVSTSTSASANTTGTPATKAETIAPASGEVGQSAEKKFRRASGEGFLAGLLPHFGNATARFDGCEKRPSSLPPISGRDESENVGVQYIPIVSDTFVGSVGVFALLATVFFWIFWLFVPLPIQPEPIQIEQEIPPLVDGVEKSG